MSLPILELEPDKKTRALRSITDMLGSYNKQKEGERLADLIGIPKEKRSEFASLPPEWQKTYAGMIQKERGAKEKALAGSGKYIKGEIGTLAPDLQLRADEVAGKYSDYIREGFPQAEARDRAIADIRESLGGVDRAEKEGASFADLFGLAGAIPQTEGDRHPSGAIPLSEKPLGERFKEVAKSLPYAGASALENVSAATPLLKLAQQKSNFPGIEELLANKTPLKREKYFETPSEKLAKGLTPEEKETGDVLSVVLGLVGPGVASKIKKLLPKRAVKPSAILQTPPEAPKQLTAQAQAAAAEEAIPKTPLEGRVTKAPQTATQMRIERARPEARIYPRLKNVELSEQQLKLHPKYVEEIAVDAAERAARAEARVPKTVKGMDSKRLRIHEAEKAYPQALESYTKSSARVRALEDEVAKLKGAQRESAETLLDLAKADLDDASFNLKQAWENLEGTNYRATVQEMRDAARKKMLDIEEAVSNGQSYELAKRDYSPDLIAKAKKIGKQKPIPSARKEDFYTQVHDVYVNEYKNRIAELDKQIAEAAKTRTLASLHHRQQLQKQKEILNKMVQSAEAEKVIQNRRFGLREMAERHKAQQRFKQLGKAEGKPEVKKVAQEKMWKERLVEAKSPEARSQVVDDGIEQIASKDPKNAEKIRAEGQKLKEGVEDLFKQKPPKSPPPLPSDKGAKNSAREAYEYLKKIQDKIESLLKKVPVLGQYELGRDIIAGAISAGIDEANKELGLNIPVGQLTTLIFGRGGKGGYRVFVRNFAKKQTQEFIRSLKVKRARDAFKKKDSKKFFSYPKSIQKEAKEQAYD